MRTISILACMFIITSANAVPLRGKDGKAVPGTDRDNVALWEIAPIRKARNAAPGAYSNKGIPLGKCDNLIVLVDFPDRKFSIKDSNVLRQKYNDMFNKKGYSDLVTYEDSVYSIYGSVKDYFIDQSYGKFEPSFTVIGPITTNGKHDFYGRNKGGYDGEVRQMVSEICDKIKGSVNLSSYDLDGDGVIEQLSVIYAGNGENYDGAEEDNIWPHADHISYSDGTITQINYLCICELFWDSSNILDGIGTFCHEFSHTLGLPDYYDTYSSSINVRNANMGYWSLMDYGCYENLGFSAAGYTAFERYSLGWLELTEITQEGTYEMPALNGDDPIAYRLTASNDDIFLILENHQQDGWYKYQQSKGMMVTAVSYDNNSWVRNYVNSGTTYRRYYILPADNDRDRETSAGDLFPRLEQDSITWYSLPQLAVTYSSSIYKPDYSIYDIRDIDGTVSFYAGKGRPTSVTDNYGSLLIQVYDLSGNLRMGITNESDIPSGLWIIRQGGETKKVKR